MYLSWSPDGAFLASESRGGDVFIWDYQKVRIIQNFRYEKDDFFPLSWSPDGNSLFIKDTIYRVKDWSIQTKLKGNIKDVAWFKDGSMLAYAIWGENKITLLDVPSENVLFEYIETDLDEEKDKTKVRYDRMAWNSDGTLLAVTREIGRKWDLVVFRLITQ
jgi:WD40 repeat protein